MARRSRQQSAAVADIGEIPAVVDPARREACRLDLHRFLVTYFPRSTGRKPFSADHVRAIGRLERCILDGGLFVQAFPRGFAKTTISENSTIWAVAYGHRKFVPIFGADANAAAGNIDSIKLELSENDLLMEDFPEVCHAIRALEGKAQRCASQTHGGKLTHIEWKADMIVLPTIAGSAAGGGIILTRGIESGCRGMKHKRPDGTQQRPDFVLIDDPQTDASAATDLQVSKRLDVIRKSILKLGGHDRKIAVVVNATVIRIDDLVERLLDPKRFPAWQGERIKMVRKWADAHEKLWLEDYARLRNTFDANTLGDQQRAHRAATDFYRRNRAKMDAGCEVSWADCYDGDTEISAIQHAYNLLIDDGEDVFASECQNEPLKPKDEADAALTADQIANKINRIPRGTLEATASRLVAFVDVHQSALFWMAAGVGEGFGGAVVDYGTYPEAKKKYFSLADFKETLEKPTGAKSMEEAIYAALNLLVDRLMSRDWKREDGTSIKPEKILIDANWGPYSNVVYEFCRRSPHAAVLIPSHGKFYGATSQPINSRRRTEGDRVGDHWTMPKPAKSGRVIRHVVFDTNYWKGFMFSRLRVGMGGRGCWAMFGATPEDHRLVADHFTAETGVEVEARGRKVVEFKLRPGRPDNHYLDCLVGCGVAASIQGVSLKELEGPRRSFKPMKLSEIQKAKAKNGGI